MKQEHGVKTQALFQLEHYSLDHRLDNICLSIHKGERVALLGPSGAGKTSLLNILHQQCADKIAWCPQHQGLVDTLSSYHNIYMGQLQQHHALYNLLNLLRPLAKPKARISELAMQLGVLEQLWQPVNTLSGGQRQRVGIGRALFRQQSTFLGDEPVSSLDPVQAQNILELIHSRHETVVIALHNRSQALTNFDRIIGLKAGHIAFDLHMESFQQANAQTLLEQLYA